MYQYMYIYYMRVIIYMWVQITRDYGLHASMDYMWVRITCEVVMKTLDIYFALTIFDTKDSF